MTTNQTPSTTTTPSIRVTTRPLSRNQLATRGLITNHADQYAAEVLRIATLLATKYARNEPDRDDLVSRVATQFSRQSENYMTRYKFPAQFVKAVIGTRFQDFLRDERRQCGLGAELITLDDGTRVTSRTRVGLQVTIDGETVDRPIADGFDAYANADVRIDIERAAALIDVDSAQAIQDIVINDEKAVDVAKRDGSAHTTISRRVNRGTKALAELLGDDYDLGAL